MKKILAILLCCVMALSFTACGSGETTESPSQSEAATSPSARDSIVIGTEGDCGSLDPFVVSGDGFMPVMNAYSETLWEYDGSVDGFASRYVLAESVDTISDTEYVIHLRKGVTFSNGSAFTASDVIWTLFHIRDDTARAYTVNNVDFERTVAEDDYTVRLFLLEYTKTTMASLGHTINILDEQTFDPDTAAGTNPIGTGPYVVKEYIVNSSVTLEARDDYWGEQPQIKKILFKNIPEASQKVNALINGEVDALITTPSSDVEYIDNLDGFHVIRKVSGDQVCLTFNARESSPLASKEARWAVAYAMDSEGVVNVALNGIGTVARAPFSSGCVDFSEAVADLHDTYATGYNLELAKKYAEESGLVGQTVRLVNNGTDVYATTAQILQQALTEIGVNAEVINMDQATVRNLIAGPDDWEIYVAWTASPTALGPDIPDGQMIGFNRCHFDYDTETFKMFEDLGDTLLTTSDQEEYNKLLVDYVTKVDEYCFLYGIADVGLIVSAVDSLQGITSNGVDDDHIADWYFVE